MVRRGVLTLIALAVSLTIAAAAYAGSKAPPEAPKERPCRADAERLCKDIKPGQGRVAACLRSHQQALSPACSARIEARKAAVGACKADREAHCADVKGRRRVRACLLEHRAALSPACGAIVDKRAPKP